MSDLPEVQRARPVVSLIIFVVLGVINTFGFLFIVPNFEQIYRDALPGMQLPWLTQFIIAGRIPLAFLVVAWPLVGIVMIWIRYRYTQWVVILGLWLFLALLSVTVIALFKPMVGHLVGAPNASSSIPSASDVNSQ